MQHTTMKVLALVCLAITVLEVAPLPCGGGGSGNRFGTPSGGNTVVLLPYNPGTQAQTAPAAPAGVSGSATVPAGRRKRNAENPPPHDHAKEQGDKPHPPHVGGKVSIKANSHSEYSSSSGKSSGGSGSASFDHKGAHLENKNSKSNSFKLGLPGMESKSDSTVESSLKLSHAQGKHEGAHKEGSFEANKGSRRDSLKVKIGGGRPKPDLHSTFSHGIGAAGAHAGGAGGKAGAAGAKTEISGKQGVELHREFGKNGAQVGSAHGLGEAATGSVQAHGHESLKGTNDAKVQALADNWHKAHGSSTGVEGAHGAAATSLIHGAGSKAHEAGSHVVKTATDIAHKGMGAAGAGASHGVELGKKKFELGAQAARAGAGIAKQGADAAKVGLTTAVAAGHHAAHKGSEAAGSAASHGLEFAKKNIELGAQAGHAGTGLANQGADATKGALTSAVTTGHHAAHGVAGEAAKHIKNQGEAGTDALSKLHNAAHGTANTKVGVGVKIHRK